MDAHAVVRGVTVGLRFVVEFRLIVLVAGRVLVAVL